MLLSSDFRTCALLYYYTCDPEETIAKTLHLVVFSKMDRCLSALRGLARRNSYFDEITARPLVAQGNVDFLDHVYVIY